MIKQQCHYERVGNLKSDLGQYIFKYNRMIIWILLVITNWSVFITCYLATTHSLKSKQSDSHWTIRSARILVYNVISKQVFL